MGGVPAQEVTGLRIFLAAVEGDSRGGTAGGRKRRKETHLSGEIFPPNVSFYKLHHIPINPLSPYSTILFSFRRDNIPIYIYYI